MINKEPLVSIIMNCYNGERYLGEAIDSVYKQTYKNWEIIFWDNASTDESAIIAKSYDAKLKYFLAESNTNLGAARVKAVDKARGNYLAFLDCDDLFNPNKITKQIQLIESNPDIGIVYSRADLISSEGEHIGYTPRIEYNLPDGKVFGDLAKYNFIPFVSALIHRSKYYECGGFPEKYLNSTDYFLFLNISYKYLVRCSDEILCSYRFHENNLSKSQYVVASLEGIDAVSKFLPDIQAKRGVDSHIVTLIMYSLFELNFKIFFWSLLRLRNPLLLMKRIFAYIVNRVQSGPLLNKI